MTGEIDLLSIDIDYNDYWIWKAVTAVSPRVVVIEYNATLRPPMSLVVPYDPACMWDGTNYFGASLEALVRLGRDKGYRVVACNYTGVNAFLCATMLRVIAFLIRRHPRSTTSRRAISTRCSRPAIAHARDPM